MRRTVRPGPIDEPRTSRPGVRPRTPTALPYSAAATARGRPQTRPYAQRGMPASSKVPIAGPRAGVQSENGPTGRWVGRGDRRKRRGRPEGRRIGAFSPVRQMLHRRDPRFPETAQLAEAEVLAGHRRRVPRPRRRCHRLRRHHRPPTGRTPRGRTPRAARPLPGRRGLRLGSRRTRHGGRPTRTLLLRGPGSSRWRTTPGRAADAGLWPPTARCLTRRYSRAGARRGLGRQTGQLGGVPAVGCLCDHSTPEPATTHTVLSGPERRSVTPQSPARAATRRRPRPDSPAGRCSASRSARRRPRSVSRRPP